MSVVEPAVAALATSDLKRSFGSVRALDGFTMSLPAGQVTALVGPNGSGKTTLLLILAGLLGPDGGSALVGGFDPVTNPYAAHRVTGWMPDFFGVYEGLSSIEYLELFGAAYGLPKGERAPRARELLATVGLEEFADRPVHTMSRGQKQRLGFARTIVHRPSVLLLDEPASGLDPRARIELRELVRRQAGDGAAVLVSSHILTELEEMADLVVFAEAGRCRGVHGLSEIAAVNRSQTWKVRAIDPVSLKVALSSAGGTELPDGSVVVPLQGDEAAADLLERLVAAGVRVTELSPMSGGLEGAFMSMGGDE
jgi:ABC-2 type transport system ATP-binding protein